MTDVTTRYHAFLDEVLPHDHESNHRSYRRDHALRREFQAVSFDEGWLAPEWEPGFGGQGLSAPEALEVKLAGARRHVPRHLNVQGAGVAAPAIREFGSEEQRTRLLRAALRGDEWWALGMSEPGAGSDLARLRTAAVLDGDRFVVNGQKVWTTQALESRWCLLYARTDPDAPRHRGISCLVLDLTAPGVDIRPIRTVGEIDSFCEVYLDDVEVPRSALVGSLHDGWRVAVASLDHERDMIWINSWLDAQGALEPVRGAEPVADPARLGRILTDIQALRFTGLRTAAQRWNGAPARAATILKLLASEVFTAATAYTLEEGGGEVADESPLVEHLESLASTIYGGTSEIQRNIIAKRTLHLPGSR